ncbi:glycosyltransferase family 61 protein [Bacteroides ovatus]|nr:glycosyltransferase family 61 protein [Bacteroides ovatus]
MNSIAPHYRDITDPDHLFGFVFDCHLTLQMRDKLLLFKSNLATPKRIFLTRKSTKRGIIMNLKFGEYLKNMGFEVVAPRNIHFCEQMALFNNADYIVGGSGAAFTNLLFCHSGCKVICFRSIRNYSPIFSTIANIVDVKMRYLAGISDSTVDLHADYIVSTDKTEKND